LVVLEAIIVARDSSRDHKLGGCLDPLPIVLLAKPEQKVVEPHTRYAEGYIARFQSKRLQNVQLGISVDFSSVFDRVL
jgi:hypothetical protein